MMTSGFAGQHLAPFESFPAGRPRISHRKASVQSLVGSPRYAGALANAQEARGFARGLQQGGYATDPAYADKLQRIINGPLLRAALSG